MMTRPSIRVPALVSGPLRGVLSESVRDFAWKGEANPTPAQNLAPMSLREDGEATDIEVDVPGQKVSDLDVTIDEGELRISGKRSTPDRPGATNRDERNFGQFERQVILGDQVDPNSIDASLRDGVRCIKFSKRPQQRSRKVTINDCGPSVKKSGPVERPIRSLSG